MNRLKWIVFGTIVVAMLLSTVSFDNLDEIVGSLLFLGVGGFLLYKGVRDLRISGRSSDTATSKIRSVPIGFAELKGRAKADETITAPFSGRPCAYYHCEIERYESTGSGKNRKTTWVSKWHDERHAPFAIRDNTGEIALDTDSAEFNSKPDKRWKLRPGSRFTVGRWRKHNGTLLELVPEAEEDAVDERSRISFGRIGTYRFTERIIAPEEEIYVLGTVKRDAVVHVGLDRRHGPFVISDRKEEKLIRHLRREAIGFFIGGVILMLIALLFLVGAFGLLA